MNWMRYKAAYFLFSGILIATSIYAIFVWGFNLGVDFKGGSVMEYKFNQDISTEEVANLIEDVGVLVSSAQSTGENTFLFKMPPLTQEEKTKVENVITERFKENAVLLKYETVGPSIGPELVKKTVYAIVIATTIILLWVAYQFKNLKYGTSAVLAMLHDSFILLGLYTLLGHFFNAEIDFLFVTALLTTLSFSVHDTIVVYDRIRESQKKFSGNMENLANMAVTQTMVRSLNNSFTIIFMLVSLLLLGGSTIRWFAAALFIGTLLGTYSSPFVAVPLLVSWESIVNYAKGINLKKIIKR